MRNSIGHYIKRMREMPKDEFIGIVKQQLNEKLGGKILCYHDKYLPTFHHYKSSDAGLNPIQIDAILLNTKGMSIEIARELWRMYQSHRFDLLGSGWVDVGIGKDVPGFEGNRYDSGYKYDGTDVFLDMFLRDKDVDHAKKVWSHISGEYTPIDWQRDFKSGYRWNAKEWYRPARLADEPGGDIKIPWELSRLQHLPRLAILYRLLPDTSEKIVREYRNQVLDFIAQNPVRMGVNYMCTMDVGIRIANLALSYSLFCAYGVKFDTQFQRILCDYFIEACNHIRKNLELSSVYRSNHYFADISGLLFGAVLLPKCRQRKEWLIFAKKEIEKEIPLQFYSEGINREGSVAYHRLTAEMAIYDIAMIHALSKTKEIDDLNRKCYEIIGRACRFLKDITRPDGIFPSMGDNDGGVFFRCSFTGELMTPKKAINKYVNLAGYEPKKDDAYYYDEELCDGRTMISAGAGIFKGFEDIVEIYPFEQSLVKAISKTRSLVTVKGAEEKPSDPRGYSQTQLKYKKEWTIELEKKILKDEIQYSYYHDFGVVIYKWKDFFLCINVIKNGQNGLAGHSHNDKLSFELFCGNKAYCEDPGTYVYTADVKLRDRFRSVKCHNTIQIGEEQNTYNGTFSMLDETRCKVVSLDKGCFEGEVRFRDTIHRRRICIEDDALNICDECNQDFQIGPLEHIHTRGYGKMLRS